MARNIKSSCILLKTQLGLVIIWFFLFSSHNFGAQLTKFTLDFETGDLRGWRKTDNAFDYQPTLDDNPNARDRSKSSKHQGRYWIGTFERFQGKPGQKRGGTQGDRPQGTLISSPFTIPSGSMSFLIGGGRSFETRVELMVGDPIEQRQRRVYSQTGKNTETMQRVIWDLRPHAGKTGQIRIVDQSSGGWGHINVDDFKFLPIIPEQPGQAEPPFDEKVKKPEIRIPQWVYDVLEPLIKWFFELPKLPNWILEIPWLPKWFGEIPWPLILIVVVIVIISLGGITIRIRGSIKIRGRKKWQEEAKEERPPERCRPCTYYCRKVELEVKPRLRKITNLILRDYDPVSGEQGKVKRVRGKIADRLDRTVRTYRRRRKTKKLQKQVITLSHALSRQIMKWLHGKSIAHDVSVTAHLEGGQVTCQFILYHCKRKGMRTVWQEIDRWEKSIRDEHDVPVGTLCGLDPAEPAKEEKLASQLTQLFIQFIEKF